MNDIPFPAGFDHTDHQFVNDKPSCSCMRLYILYVAGSGASCPPEESDDDILGHDVCNTIYKNMAGGMG